MALLPFSIVDGNGRVLMTGMSPELPPVPDGCILVEAAQPSATAFWDGAAEDWREPAPRPTPAHVFDWSSHTWRDLRPLEVIRADHLAGINAEARRRAAALIGGYPDFERQTWPAQEREALAWQADPAAPTPYLDGIAAVRGITPDDMRAKTLEAVLAFRSASQYLVGMRQALRDQVTAAETVEAIQAVAWPPESSTPDQP